MSSNRTERTTDGPPPVVVGVDGSAAALHAVEWAAHEAARRHRPLLLVSCYSVPFYGEPGLFGSYAIENQVEAIKVEHEGFVHLAAKRAAELEPYLSVRSVVVLGSPAITLAQYITPGSELVVGSTGHSGKLADVVGSTATAVCHHVSNPVVVVPAASSKRGRSMKKIVVGTDGSPAALDAVSWAYDEARMAHAELVVLHSWEYPYTDGTDGASDFRKKMRHDAAAQLDADAAALATRASADGVKVVTRLIEKLPAQALIDEAADADLVVVGSRGRGGLSSMLLGSVSRAVVQHAPCPVAVIRHPNH